MARETAPRDFLEREAEERSISGEARNARGRIWNQEEGEEAWVSEVRNLALADALGSGLVPIRQTQKVTLVSLLEARKIRGESTSIKLPPVSVAGQRDQLKWLTTKTETS